MPPGRRLFGHVDIADDGRMSVSLRDLGGAVLFRQDLEPQHSVRAQV